MLVTDDQEPAWADAMRGLTEVVLVAKHAQAPLASASSGSVSSDGASSDGASSRRAAFVTVTRLDGSLGLAGAAPEATALLGGAAGVVKTLAIEAPGLFCRALDIHPGLDPTPHGGGAARRAARRGHRHHRGRRGRRAGPAHRYAGPLPPGEAAGLTVGRAASADLDVRADDVFVVTGGARGITALCVAELAARGPPNSSCSAGPSWPPSPAWARGVPDAGLKAAVIAAARAAGNRPAPREIERQYADLTAQREIRATLAGLAAAALSRAVPRGRRHRRRRGASRAGGPARHRGDPRRRGTRRRVPHRQDDGAGRAGAAAEAWRPGRGAGRRGRRPAASPGAVHVGGRAARQRRAGGLRGGQRGALPVRGQLAAPAPRPARRRHRLGRLGRRHGHPEPARRAVGPGGAAARSGDRRAGLRPAVQPRPGAGQSRVADRRADRALVGPAGRRPARAPPAASCPGSRPTK